jgi:hypothetical protein
VLRIRSPVASTLFTCQSTRSEESILGCGLPASWQVGVAAYEAARAMTELNLRLGHDVVVDPNSTLPTRLCRRR